MASHKADSQAFGNGGADLQTRTHLVVVCCHATFTGDGTSFTEDDWILQPFQKADPSSNKPSEIWTFANHILAADLACRAQPGSMLMFSGGHTTSSERSEAASYREVYKMLGPKALGLLPHVLEEKATDSYQNLLFSISKFSMVTGRYPEAVTVVTHAFKERRFLELHAKAIKWPLNRLRVLGLNPPFSLQELEETQKMEHQQAYQLFAQDPYGVRSPLAGKRRARNWDPAVFQDLDVEESVRPLLAWRGGESGQEILSHMLPWEDTGQLES